MATHDTDETYTSVTGTALNACPMIAILEAQVKAQAKWSVACQESAMAGRGSVILNGVDIVRYVNGGEDLLTYWYYEKEWGVRARHRSLEAVKEIQEQRHAARKEREASAA